MRFCLILLIILASQISIAQDPVNPGGLGVENLSAWFKATDLEIDDDVTAWPTSFTNQANTIILEDNEAPYPYATNVGRYSNYNNAVSFAGNTGEVMKVLQSDEQYNLLDNTSIGSTGTFLAAYYLPPDNECSGCHVVNYREGTSGSVDGIQFRAKIGEQVGRLAIGTGNSDNGSTDYLQDFKPNLVSYSGNKSSENSMRSFRRSLAISEGNSSATSGDTGLFFGGRKYNGDKFNAVFDGLIYEVIFYDRDLSDEELSMVHTYLAVKHGITLDNLGGGEQGDYISPIGQVVWDADYVPEFHSQVIGIASDGSEGLNQLQSHSFGDSTRVYLDELASATSENKGIFNNARSYVMIGNNSGQLCGTEASNNEVPENFDIIERVEREWKVTNTNFSQDLSMDFTLGSCIDVNSMDNQQLRFLVDENDDFSNANVYTTGAAVKLSLKNGVVKVQDIATELLPINETRFVTVAISSVLSNNEEAQVPRFTIYPNPAKGYFTVESESEAELQLYNSLGQKITKIEIHEISNNKRVVDISQIPSGSYFVQIGATRQTLIK